MKGLLIKGLLFERSSIKRSSIKRSSIKRSSSLAVNSDFLMSCLPKKNNGNTSKQASSCTKKNR